MTNTLADYDTELLTFVAVLCTGPIMGGWGCPLLCPLSSLDRKMTLFCCSCQKVGGEREVWKNGFRPHPINDFTNVARLLTDNFLADRHLVERGSSTAPIFLSPWRDSNPRSWRYMLTFLPPCYRSASTATNSALPKYLSTKFQSTKCRLAKCLSIK